MRREVVNRDFDALPFLQLAEDADEQLKVEGVRVVEVVLVLGGQLLLLFVQHLQRNSFDKNGSAGKYEKRRR